VLLDEGVAWKSERRPVPVNQWSIIGGREVLQRDLYRGAVTFGNVRRPGPKTRVKLPRGQWQTRTRGSRQEEHVRETGRGSGRTVGHAEAIVSHYLFSGLPGSRRSELKATQAERRQDEARVAERKGYDRDLRDRREQVERVCHVRRSWAAALDTDVPTASQILKKILGRVASTSGRSGVAPGGCRNQQV
jgi:hypothetical protein